MVLAQFICERHGDVRRKRRQGDRRDDEVGKRQPTKSRSAPKRKQNSGVISADVWDETVYGDADTNEALAADIFNFSAQEFEHVSSKWKGAFSELASAASSPATSLASHAAISATLLERGQDPLLSGHSRLLRQPTRAMALANSSVAMHPMQHLLRYQQNPMHVATAHLQQLQQGQQQQQIEHQIIHYGQQQQQQPSLNPVQQNSVLVQQSQSVLPGHSQQESESQSK
jgi:hypothetical protein